MVLEISIRDKPFSAKIAREQLFLGVGPHMLQQAAVVAVLLVTAIKWASFYFRFVVFNHVFYLILIV
jgi:hypothetical protein